MPNARLRIDPARVRSCYDAHPHAPRPSSVAGSGGPLLLTIAPVGWDLAVAGLVGALLGALYFGGLWWTVRRMPTVHHPHRWLLLSFVARAAVVLMGFLAVVHVGNAMLLLVALLGFAVARWIMIRHVRTTTSP